MKRANLKRHLFSSLLGFHFLGLAMSVGARFADFAIERGTSRSSLQSLWFGRDLTGLIARSVVLPGFLLVIATGFAMVLLRYGRRPPVWVWIKAGVTATALLIATALAAPALTAARQWARWSFEHDQLALQFNPSATKAGVYGGIVFLLFLSNIPIAIWKPFASVKLPRLRAQQLKA